MRPKLTKELSSERFRDYYWLKEELQTFCRNNGMSPSESKSDLANRIDMFLKTGEIKKPARVVRRTTQPKDLSLDTIITKNHRCSQTVRAFFKSVIPNFHFSTYMQNYFKNNIGKTYRDAVDAWYEEENRRKDPNYQTEIGAQFEYNQFIRDYFADPDNQSKGRDEAIKAWHEIKRLPGSNTYKST